MRIAPSGNSLVIPGCRVCSEFHDEKVRGMTAGRTTVFVLIREDQNEHGYVDTSIAGVFREAGGAKEMETLERLKARQEGLVVEDDDSPDGEWQISWKVEEHTVD